MSRWEKKKLSKITTSCLGKMLDAEKNRGEYQPYLANINVRWGGFDLSNLSEMRFEDAESERYGIRKGDLIVCEGGEPGRCAIWDEQVPNMKIQKALHRVRAENGLDIRYLYYWLFLAAKRRILDRHFTGSTIKHLPGENLTEIEVDVPDKETQTSIADVLSLLDRKIGHNNSINAELDKAAKLLYDYWFVQFDFPNAEGKPYRASGGELIYNEQLKRDVPKEWKVKKFGTLFDVTKGELITEKDAEEGDVKVVAAGLTYSYLHSTPNRAANTITISASGANAGFVNFWREPIYASDCITVRGKDDLDTILAHLFLRFMQKAISKKATGSAQPHVYPDDIKELWVCDIPASLKEQLRNTLVSMNNKAALVLRETAELTALRDFLLPLLMNGQVRVCG